MPPGENQVVRVEWVGGPVEQSRDFIFRVDQLPVDFIPEEQEGSRVQFLFNFGAAVHVSPQGARPDLAIASANRENGAAQVRMRNSGDRHVVLGDRGLTGSAGGVTREYTGDELADAMGNALIAADAAREVRIALPADFPAGPLTAAVPERD